MSCDRNIGDIPEEVWEREGKTGSFVRHERTSSFGYFDALEQDGELWRLDHPDALPTPDEEARAGLRQILG